MYLSIYCESLGFGYKWKQNFEHFLMDSYLFTKLIGADVVYQKNLVEEIFSDGRVCSTTKSNQKACGGCA